jgi:four helix bundle protein
MEVKPAATSVVRFEGLEAWQQARRLVRSLYELTRQGTLARDHGLMNQLQRAGVSIMSNIAEGFERTHLQEKLQFYNVARASTGEVRSLLYVVEDSFPAQAPTSVLLRDQTVVVGQLVSGLIRSTEARKTLRAS